MFRRMVVCKQTTGGYNNSMDFTEWQQTTLECSGAVIERLTHAASNPTLNNYCISRLSRQASELWKVDAARIQLEIENITVAFAADGLSGISVACHYQYSSYRGAKATLISIDAEEIYSLFGDARDEILADLASEDADVQSEV